MKGRFLTPKSTIQQLNKKGMYRVCDNELYEDEDEQIYLCWRNFQTDNFTWINSSDWDIRCSHFHDVGCKYHQVVKVHLSEAQMLNKGILEPCRNSVDFHCNDIPPCHLSVVNISGTQINNMFYRMLKASGAPKYVQLLYRAGVAFNVNWFRTGKKKINLNHIYKEEYNCG